ncbi:MAG: CopG family transcriptional regulator [Gammaproteobacteria bacterium]
MKNQKNDSKKEKKSTSLRLEKKTLKSLKIMAIEKDTSLQNLIEGLIEDALLKYNSTSK